MVSGAEYCGTKHGDPGRGNRGENQSKNIEENTWFSYRGHPGLSENIGG